MPIVFVFLNLNKKETKSMFFKIFFILLFSLNSCLFASNGVVDSTALSLKARCGHCGKRLRLVDDGFSAKIKERATAVPAEPRRPMLESFSARGFRRLFPADNLGIPNISSDLLNSVKSIIVREKDCEQVAFDQFNKGLDESKKKSNELNKCITDAWKRAVSCMSFPSVEQMSILKIYANAYYEQKSSRKSLPENVSNSGLPGSAGTAERISRLFKDDSLKELPQSSGFTESISEIRKIAIIGGGGAGSIIAALLSNLSEKAENIKFEITLFERNPAIINGSTFEVAAVLHAGGREYPTDATTAAQCQMTGLLFQKMFPELYGDKETPVIFAVNSNSSLTPEDQKITHYQAKRKKMELGFVETSVDKDSQNDLSQSLLQDIFSENLSEGVFSKRDRPMKIFERNYLLKRYIAGKKNIIVRTGTIVNRIEKDAEDCFNVIYDESDSVKFDHVILTAWDGIKSILRASQSLSSDITPHFSEFKAEDRVMALCDIRSVQPLYRTPLFTLTDGMMFFPLNDHIGLVYCCIAGGSYPTDGMTEILPEYGLKHGQRIIDELKSCFIKRNERPGSFDNVELLGVRLQKIVKKVDASLSERCYEPPVVTTEGFIVAIPPKATFISSLALQTIEQLLQQLPTSFDDFKNTWIREIHKLVPNNERLYTGDPVPEVFSVKQRYEITQEEILREATEFLSNCELNEKGIQLFKSYKYECTTFTPIRRIKTEGHDRKSHFFKTISDPCSIDPNTKTSLIELKVFDYYCECRGSVDKISIAATAPLIQSGICISLDSGVGMRKHSLTSIPTSDIIYPRRLNEFESIGSEVDADQIFNRLKKESAIESEDQRLIGPRFIEGWELEDVEDEGNCFYDAVVLQMASVDHRFLKTVPNGTLPRDSLRILIQGTEFQDREWAEERKHIEELVKELDVILSVVDTRNPEPGFTHYFMHECGEIITVVPDERIELPEKITIKIATTGNHFLSVKQHP